VSAEHRPGENDGHQRCANEACDDAPHGQRSSLNLYGWVGTRGV
jgi:hypothetical protein